MKFTIEHEREEDGRWLAEVPELPGVLAYGATADEAMAKAEVLALRVLADRLEHNEALVQGPTGTLSSLPDWMGAQAPIRFTQDSFTSRLA
jgi:predicted RNase H-like HicB family nuclease